MSVVNVTAAQALVLMESGLVEWPPAVIGGVTYLYGNQIGSDGKREVYRIQ